MWTLQCKCFNKSKLLSSSSNKLQKIMQLVLIFVIPDWLVLDPSKKFPQGTAHFFPSYFHSSPSPMKSTCMVRWPLSCGDWDRNFRVKGQHVMAGDCDSWWKTPGDYISTTASFLCFHFWVCCLAPSCLHANEEVQTHLLVRMCIFANLNVCVGACAADV